MNQDIRSRNVSKVPRVTDTTVPTSHARSRHRARRRSNSKPRAIYKYESSVGFFLFMATNLIAALIAFNVHTTLPKPVNSNTPSFQFSEERAWIHMNKIASFGIRTVGGYPNEIQTPAYILDFIERVNNSVSQTNNGSHFKLDLSIQKATGAFILENFLGGFVNAYENVTNILVRLTNPNNPATIENTILINTHYDSALGTAAMSDDGIMVANALEILNNLMHSPNELNIGIIFNFNGAEETVLQAAHGFISQHPWRNTIKAFINLEAAGTGGKEMLFQSGPGHSWLIETYKRAVPYPYGSSFAQELFDTGIIPSLTDFTIYRDYGDSFIPGIDFAYIKNGYLYHTTLDDLEHIEPGSLQHCGENTLAIVNTLNLDAVDSDSPFFKYINNVSTDALGFFDEMWIYESSVFFDLFSAVFVVYPASVAWLIHLTLLLSFLYIMKRSFWGRWEIFVLSQRILVANVFAIVACIIIGLLSFVMHRMVWYSYPKFTFPLFGIPFLVTVIGLHHRWNNSSTLDTRLSRVNIEDFFIAADWMLWSFSLLISSAVAIGLSFYPLFWCVSLLMVHIIRATIPQFCLRMFRNECILLTDILHCLAILFPLIVHYVIVDNVLEVFIPIMGRSGTEVPSDIVVAILVGFLFCMSLTSGVHFIYRMSKKDRRSVLYALLIGSFAFEISTLLVMRVYTESSPKRVYFQHTTRNFQNDTEDIGLFVNAFDAVGLDILRTLDIPEFENAVTQPCDYLYPWFLPVEEMIQSSWYIPIAQKPIIPNEYLANVEIINQTYATNDQLLTYIRLKGPSHWSIMLDTTEITEWSFDTPVFKGDHHTFIFYATGMRIPPDADFINLRADISEQNLLAPVRAETIFWIKCNIGDTPLSAYVSAHHINGDYVHNTKNYVFALKRATQRLPKWIDFIVWFSEFYEIPLRTSGNPLLK